MMNVTAYSAAAGAVASLVRAAGHELSHEGITVNAISLGWMDWMDDRLTPGDEYADRARRFPMSRRLGVADDLGGLAVLLSAEESAPYITGQVFAVDGGLTQHQ
jgi:NAD(P)-dependent dehydrogenase (short-subunit alcohol dehydrogenase family)